MIWLHYFLALAAVCGVAAAFCWAVDFYYNYLYGLEN